MFFGRTDAKAETPIFGHLMQRVDSLEKTLMLGGTGGRRRGKTRDLYKKSRNTKGNFHSKMGTIKDRNSMDLMATHCRVLAWRIPGMGEPVGLPSMGLHRVGHD